MKKLFFLFLIVQCTLKIENSMCQWQPDVRLTNGPAASYTSLNNARCVAVNGDSVHVVWYDSRGNWEINYKRSIDGGISWGAVTWLTNIYPATAVYPSVSVYGSGVHVVWYDSRNGNWEIYYNRSTDGGSSWGSNVRLTNNAADSKYPSVSVYDSVVHVVWEDSTAGNRVIYYKRSTDGGSSWGADTLLTYNSDFPILPSVSVSDLVVHVVWWQRGNYEVYYKRSTDGGSSWGADTRLSDLPNNSTFPSVSASGTVVHVVWHDSRHENAEIYYKRSTDEGISWGADTRLTNNPGSSLYASISVSSSGLHVVWTDTRDGNWEIYHKRSTDGGLNWDADTRLTNNPAFSYSPSVSVSGSVVHVVWFDDRDGNSAEIYYKRNPTGNLVGIININSEIPREYSLNQNYPNPFNPVTVIRYSLNEYRFVKLKVYDVLGNEVFVLVNDKQKAGTYEVDFDGSKFASGVYYYKLIAGDYTETRKMVLTK